MSARTTMRFIAPSTPLRPLPTFRALHTSSLALAARASSSSSSGASSFSRPSPPPLPPAEQAEFEKLLKANQTVGATPAIVDDPQKGERAAAELANEEHRDLRKGPKRDFEGDTNPRTGEVGGPKTDPFIAGDKDWQYGGRITDF